MEFLNNVIKGVESFGSGQLIMSVMIALEFAFRMIKSEKPLSIMYIVADGLKKVGELCSKLGSILDKILPQRLK
jgi:DNA-binding HxlR family transcriptional regulator